MLSYIKKSIFHKDRRLEKIITETIQNYTNEKLIEIAYISPKEYKPLTVKIALGILTKRGIAESDFKKLMDFFTKSGTLIYIIFRKLNIPGFDSVGFRYGQGKGSEYYKQPDKIKWIKDELINHIKANYNNDYYNILLYYNFLLVVMGDVSIVDLDIMSYQEEQKISLESLIKKFTDFIDKEVELIIRTSKKEMEHINDIRYFILEEVKRKYCLAYFEYNFENILSSFNTINDANEIRKIYKEVSKDIESKAYSAHGGNLYANYLNEDEIKTYKVPDVDDVYKRDSYKIKLRIKVIERLKDIEGLTPYRDLISQIIKANPNFDYNYTGIGKFFEWDLFYNKKPSIHEFINKKANMQYRDEKDLNASEYIFLFQRKNLTPFGYEHIYEVSEKLEIVLKEYLMKHKKTLLQKYSEKYTNKRSRYIVKWLSKDTLYYSYCDMILFESELHELTREAENRARKELKVKPVGEEWISEIELYKKLKKHYKERKVIHHARLSFLGLQHLDIFIPSYRVAIEYQGEQHYNPVDYFGGEEAFLETQKRDKRKFEICNKNNVKIVYVRKGYELETIINEIENSKV